MNKTLLASLLALGITAVSTTAMGFELGQSRQGRGIDNSAGHIRQGRGADDPAGHIRQGRGADDVGGARGAHADGHISGRDRVRAPGDSGRRGRGRGSDDPIGHIRGGQGADNPIGHVRQVRGADDVGGVRGVHADGHISGRDRVPIGGMGAAGLLSR